MKKFLVTGLLAFTALAMKAQSDEWLDPEVNAVNRLPMHSNYFAYELSLIHISEPTRH